MTHWIRELFKTRQGVKHRYLIYNYIIRSLLFIQLLTSNSLSYHKCLQRRIMKKNFFC